MAISASKFTDWMKAGRASVPFRASPACALRRGSAGPKRGICRPPYHSRGVLRDSGRSYTAPGAAQPVLPPLVTDVAKGRTVDEGRWPGRFGHRMSPAQSIGESPQCLRPSRHGGQSVHHLRARPAPTGTMMVTTVLVGNLPTIFELDPHRPNGVVGSLPASRAMRPVRPIPVGCPVALAPPSANRLLTDRLHKASLT